MIIPSWVVNKAKKDEERRKDPNYKPPSDFFSWLKQTGQDIGESDLGKAVGTGIDTFFSGTKNLYNTAALIPQNIVLANDLNSGKISVEDYNKKLQEAYDQQPFFKLEKGKDGLLHQKTMNPLEFLGGITKAGTDAGLEVAPFLKGGSVIIKGGQKFTDVAPALLKQGAAYGGLGVVNDTMQRGSFDPGSAAFNAGAGLGGSLASYPITKGAIKGADFIKNLLGGNKAQAVENAAAKGAGEIVPNKLPADDNTPAFIRRAQQQVSEPAPIDVNDVNLPAYIRRGMNNTTNRPGAAFQSQIEDALNSGDEIGAQKIVDSMPEGDLKQGMQSTLDAIAGRPNKYKNMAQEVGKGPTEQIQVDLGPVTSPSRNAARDATEAVLGNKKSTTEFVAELPEKAAAKKGADLATPDDLLTESRAAAARQLQNTRKALQEATDKLPTLKPNTSEYQATQKQIQELTKAEREAHATYAKTAQAKSMDDLVNEAAPNDKAKANIVDMLRTPERVLDKLGLKEESKFLRASYENYQKELPQEIDKVSAWAKQVNSEENTRIFQILDGKNVVDISPKEQKIANEIRSYLQQWAKRLGLPEDKQISNYITHIFEKDFIKKEFDPDIARLIRDKIPGSVYNPFLQKRLGQLGYKEDAIAALDAYVKRAVRSANMNPALDRISNAAENLDADSYNYVKKFIDRVNMRPTDMENFLDNFLKATPLGYKLGGRPTAAISRNVRQMIYRATLGLNPGSAIRNLTQGANTYAKLGEKYTVVGYMKMLKNLVNRSKELEDVGVLGNDFVQDRTISATKQALQKMDKGLFSFFDLAERINRGAAYYGAKAKALAKGASEDDAINTAKQLVRETQFNYGAIDTPVAMNSALAKSLAQFQSYNVKQGEFIGNLIKSKDIAGILRLSAASAIFLYTIGKLVGMEPKDFIPGSRMTQSGVAGGLVGPLWGLADKAVKSTDDYGNELSPGERVTNFGEQAFKTLFPGGSQISKTLQGLQAANQGGTTDSAGRTKYNIGSDEAIQSVLFGPNSTQSAKQYYQNKSSGGSSKSKSKKRSSSRRSSSVER